MFCAQCGKPVEDGIKACAACGSVIATAPKKNLSEEMAEFIARPGTLASHDAAAGERSARSRFKPMHIVLIACAVLAAAILLGWQALDSGNPAGRDGNVNVADTEQEAVPEDWRVFSPEGGAFSILFPGNPEHDTERIDIPDAEGDIRFDYYLSEGAGDTIYYVGVSEYPAGIDISTDPQKSLTEVLRGKLTFAAGSSIVSSDFLRFQDRDAINYSIESPEVNIRGRDVLAGNTLYQLMVLFRNDFDEGDYEHFIESFDMSEMP